jgi:para-nitrobenzyl esterase
MVTTLRDDRTALESRPHKDVLLECFCRNFRCSKSLTPAFISTWRRTKMRARQLMILISIAFVIVQAVSCRSKAPEVNALGDPIKIDTGYISGTVIGDVGKEVRIYRGIPYAAPPVGDLRWKPPQPAAPWPGIRECTAFGKSSPQSTMPFDLSDMPPSEDCLYLNVLTPAKIVSANLPVMVWLHGGGYATGSGSGLFYNLPRLSQKGVVLVTVNMRLGSMGLLAHPLLSKESPKAVSGNYMFFDMIAALQWVQKNVAAFGGNSENVTIFGQSGGGAKVNCLAASHLANGLFQRGICEGGAAGTVMPGEPIKDLEALGQKLFAKLGLNKESNPLKKARALPPDKIIEAETVLAKDLNRRALWDAAIDGQFLADAPANIFRAGKQNAVPIIACANLGELTGPGMILMPFLIPDYVNMLNGVNKAGQKGYACIFDQVPGKWKQEGCVSSHGLELSYLFGDWETFPRSHPSLFYGAIKAAGAKSQDPGLTDADKRVSEKMSAIWTQFARTGNPNVEGLINWPAYESATDQYLYIVDPLQVKSGFSKVAQKK